MTIADTPDPLSLFDQWMADAEAHEPDLPNAMTLATVDAHGRPHARAVLLKDSGPQGFTFYTNLGSPKAHELVGNPHASLLFHWKSLTRQVRIDGETAPVSDADADAYFATRPRDSQIGAWASRQSEILPARRLLEQRVAEFERRFDGGPVPRPGFWSGFRLRPETFEFWLQMPYRLHDRVVYLRDGDAWSHHRVYP